MCDTRRAPRASPLAVTCVLQEACDVPVAGSDAVVGGTVSQGVGLQRVGSTPQQHLHCLQAVALTGQHQRRSGGQDRDAIGHHYWHGHTGSPPRGSSAGIVAVVSLALEAAEYPEWDARST